MDQANVAIKSEAVYKDFVLPHERAGSVKGIFTSMFRHATIKNEKQHALKDISFEVKKGEFFGIVGRNGSGKSTMLKILAGIYQPTKGTIATYGKLVPFIELGVGFNPELTGRDNVYLNGAMLGFSTKEVDAMYNEIVSFAELERFMDQKLKNYSSGMQVRLAFSMAIRSEADILLIDEVLAVGDADFQRKCFEYFKKLKKYKRTVVFVSHDMEAIRQYCDRAILIEDSVLVEEGSANKIAQSYLKQFMEQAEDESSLINEGENRWGEGQVRVEAVSVKVMPAVIKIHETIQAHKDVEGCTVGFMIKTTSGERVTGTNNRLEHKTINSLKAGETIQLIWTIPNILSDGGYSLDLSIHNSEVSVVYDWWDDTSRFSVRKDRSLPYTIDPGFELEIVKDKS